MSDDNIYLQLPFTEYRPEAMRVRKQDEFFLVETWNERLQRWIVQKEWLVPECAIADAMTWYPMPDAAKHTFSWFCASETVGTMSWTAYDVDDESSVYRKTLRGSKEAFAAMQEAFAALAHNASRGENDCVFFFNEHRLTVKGRFVSDHAHIHKATVEPKDVQLHIEALCKEIKEHHAIEHYECEPLLA